MFCKKLYVVKTLLITILGVAMLFSVSHAKEDLFGIPEIPIPGLRDVAMASFSQTGQPVIYYNPSTVASLNAVSPEYVMFVRAHEYGHHKLGHIKKQVYMSNPYARLAFAQQSEIAADRYATKYWMEHDPNVIDAVVAAMNSPIAGNWGDWTHLPSPVRARLIIAYANELKTGELDPNGGNKVCSKCDGTGQLKCTRCRGEGRVRCTTCYGSGMLTCIYGPCSGCSFSGRLYCADCNATGGYDCTKCDGQGTVDCKNCRN